MSEVEDVDDVVEIKGVHRVEVASRDTLAVALQRMQANNHDELAKIIEPALRTPSKLN